MGIFDKLGAARRKREEEERERQRERERQDQAERDRAAVAKEQERQRHEKQQALDRERLAEQRQAVPGAAERLFADDATKTRMREAASRPAQPERETKAQEQQRDKVATELERKYHPTTPAPTLGPGGTSRTAQRETLAQRLQRESREAAPSPAPENVQTREVERQNHPKPEVARLHERNLSSEQVQLRQIADDHKAHKIDRVTALDRELGVLTRQPERTRTLFPDRSKGRSLTDED
jgi:colicin import membrane protein